MLTEWDYQTKTARQQDNFGRQLETGLPFLFSQHMKKLVTGYRMAKENDLEERTMEEGVKVSKEIADNSDV